MNDYIKMSLEILETPKSYWGSKDMLQGDNRIRILKEPIVGWLGWESSQPFRFRLEDKPTRLFKNKDGKMESAKLFWICYIWNYDLNDIYIFEFTQSTIIKPLIGYVQDADWGDFKEYDIKINKQGTGFGSTKYDVKPTKPTPISDEVKRAMEQKPVNLEALYDGGDPWNDLGAVEGPQNIQPSNGITQSQADELEESLNRHPVYKEKIVNFASTLNLNSLSELPFESYEKAMKGVALEDHKAAKITELPF